MSHASLLLTVLLLVLSATRPMYAGAADTSCGIIWDEPILLSDTTVDCHSPQIALSGDDTIHVVWEGGPERLPYVRSTDGGASFIRHDLDSASATELIWARLCSEGQRVYVFFRTPIAGGSPLMLRHSTDGGTSWDTVRSISPDIVGEIRSASASGDTLSVVCSAPVVKRILRSTDSGHTWTLMNEGLNYFARVALSPGVLHLVQIASNETQYRRSHDLGDTWVQQTLLSTVDGWQSSDPTIAASTTPGDTTVIAAWRDPKYGCIGVFGCSIIGRTGQVGDSLTIWDPEHVHTPEPRGFEPSLAMHGGRNAVAWRYEVNPGMTYHALVQISDTGIRSWCAPTDITPETQFKVITVEVALSNIAVHVVWSQNVAPDPSTFRIFYRRGRFMTTDVREEEPGVPGSAMLQQNYPNPFNPKTVVSYELRVKSEVRLVVYDALGREVATLVNGKKEPGEHSVEWNAEGLPSGVYYYRLTTPDGIETRKAVLIR